MRLKALLKSLILQQWNIGFANTPVEDIINGGEISFQWMKHDYKNRWFADPFILDVTDEDYIILAEDFEDDRGYAVISRLIIDKETTRLKDVKTVLDVGSHLSFPFISRQGNEVYVYPENSREGALKVYRYDSVIEELIFQKTLIDEPLTDAVFLKSGDGAWMFTTKLPDPNGKEMFIYYQNSEGQFELHDSIIFQDRTARMGGAFFFSEGSMYRPAQDNNDAYGGALVIQKVIHEGDKWVFQDIRRVTSPNPDYTTGLHTFNLYKGTVVVDVHGYRNHPKLSGLIDSIRNLNKHSLR